MKDNQYTQKSITAINAAQALASEYGNQELSQAHLLAALTDTLYPDQAELDQINESTYLSWVRDEQSLKVFELAAKNTYVSPLKFASPVDSQWQSKLGEILQGKVTAAQALQEVKNQYDVTLDELWELIDIGDDAG